jgi:hypothetical protein
LVSSLQPSAFVTAVVREVKQQYAAQGREPHTVLRHRFGQIWWGSLASVHYEVQVHERALQLELGLHFEAHQQTNRELLQLFSNHILEIQEALGESVWVEEWDRGWTRIYETQPLYPMDDARVYSAAARLCEIIDYLQPILEASGSIG